MFREKKKEKEREELWKNLEALELNPPKDGVPHILSKTPMTDFTTKRENVPGTHNLSAIATNTSGEKSPNSSKRSV